MEELWKDIKGYEGLYQASNLGRIKSLKREWQSANGSKRKHGEIILKQRVQKTGYLLVKLCKNGKQKYMSVHRIIAEMFLSNPSNLPQVNHIDGNKQNNKTENLEWVTPKQNIEHATKNNLIDSILRVENMRRIGKKQKGRSNKQWKGNIKIYDTEMNIITECETLSEVGAWLKENTQYTNPSLGNICTYIRKGKPIYGFIFKRMKGE